MTYGLKIRNSTNTVQIDDVFVNNALYSKVRVTLVKDSYGNTYRFSTSVPATLSGSFYNIAVALVDTSLDFYIAITKAGNNYTVIGYFLSGTPRTVEVDIFTFADSTKSPQGNGNYGLRVFNSAGEVTFDSRLKYMRVTRSVAPKIPEISWGLANAAEVVTEDYPVMTGRRYAICMGSYRSRSALEVWAYPGEMDAYYHTMTFNFFGGFRITSNVVKYYYWCTNNGQDSTQTYPHATDAITGFTNALILDVTDY